MIGIIEADSHDMLDQIAMAGLPMAKYLKFDLLTPVREYESFGQDIDDRWAALAG